MENSIVKIVRISQNLSLRCIALVLLFMGMGVNGYGQTHFIKNNYFKTILLAFLLFLSLDGFAQPPSMSVNTDCNGTYSNKGMTEVGVGSNNRVFTFREAANATTSSGTKFYQFNSDGYNNRWELTTPTYNTTTTAIWSAGGYNGGIKMGATVSGRYYTFNLRKGTSYANQSMSILETSYNPVTINSYTTGLVVTGGQTATVTVTMAAALNSSEYLYVAYSTDAFATSGNSGVVAIPSINGSFQGNATIPAYTVGTVVSYYAFTSVSATAPTFANVPLLTLNMRNDFAQNTNQAYTSYTVTAAAAITAAKIGVNFNGAGTLFKYTVEPSCDTGPAAWTGANLGTLYVGDPIVVTGGNLFANTALTATQFFYRVWLQSGSGGAYSNFNVTTLTTPVCGNKYETTGGSAIVPLTNYATPGTYNFDVYHQGLNGASTLNLGTAGTPYTATFIVNALNNPNPVSATAASTTSINLTWTKSVQNNNVMVVRYPFGSAVTAPTQGTAYAVTNTLGLGTVVYNGAATTSLNASLAASTQYTYYFYSQNNNYYSSGVSASATTLTPAITAAKIGVNFNGAGTLFKYTVEPSCDTGPAAWTGANLGTLYVGDPIVVTGGNLFANTALTATQFFYRVWLQSGSGGAYSNFNVTTLTTPVCGNKYETTGGSAAVPLTNYATPGTYNFDVYHQGLNGASTLNLGTAGTPYTATFVVSAINNPNPVSAAASSTTSINLTWTKSAQNNNVMVVRYPFGSAVTAPTQGTAYVVSNTLGLGTVVYNGGATTSLNASLAASTQYTYYFYSENYSYYSSGVAASATTLTPVITAAKIGVNFNGAGPLFKYTVEPSCDTGPAAWTGANLGTLYVGDPIVVTGGNLFANTALTATQFFYRVWLQSGSGGAYSNFNVTTLTTPVCGNKYETTGGSAVVPLTNYATPGTYNFDVYHQGLNGASTLNLGTAGTPYTATFIVNALNNPSGVSVVCSTTSTQLDLSWTKSAQNNNVMVVRYPFGSAVTAPTQGTAYAVTNTLGLGTVVYNGSGTTSSNTTGLTANTQYTYYFYSENYGYYSTGVNASATTSTAQPGVITGTPAQCPSTAGQVYSVSAVSGATSYTWTVPTGWIITAGQTTNSITVTAGVAGQDGTISVVANNVCGNSLTRTLAVTISSLNFINLQSPATASICQGSTFVSYGKVYEPGVTDNASQGAGIDVEFGYHSSNTNPNTWPSGNWTAATYYNLSILNDDEYSTTFGSSLPDGTYYYTYRFRLNGCAWQYAGSGNIGIGEWNGTTNISGVLTVTSIPTVTSPTSTSITSTTATLGGNLTSIGCSNATERGIYYSTTNGFANGTGTKVATTGTFSATGVFTQSTTGLSPGTVYYYKAFATNSSGTGFSVQGTFTTLANPPTVAATTAASAIFCRNATSGGNITSDGGATINERGVVYATTTTPTTSNTKIVSTGTIGSFVSNLSGLTPSTLYYVRAFATNSAGTTYGTQTTFTTTAVPTSTSFYSDRIYFKNGSNADQKFYLENNAVPNGGCSGTKTETAGTALYDGQYLGVTNAGLQVKLGGYIITKGIQNGNTPKINYRVYLTSTGPGATPFTQFDMSFVGECDADGVTVNSSNQDKIWRNPLFNITMPTPPGNYTIELYYEKSGDELGAGGTVYVNNCGSNYKATIDVVRLEGLFSDVIYFSKNNGTTTTNYTAGGVDSCDGGTAAGGNWDSKDLGNIASGQVLKIGTTTMTLENASNVVKTNQTFLNYRVYQVGGTVPAFTPMLLTEASGTTCSDSKISKFENNAGTTIFTTPAVDGIYIIELYYTAQLNDNSYLTLNNNGSNYKARFTIYSAVASTLPVSDVFESYAFLKTVTGAGVETNDFYELDAAYGSSLAKGFRQPLGTYPPGTNFYLGAEMKIYSKNLFAHKVCECSSWYYIYRPTETAPQASDFPLPTDGTNFTSTGNGLFLKSAVLGDVSSSASEPSIHAGASTTNNTYNALLGNTSGKDITKIRKYQNKATAVDTEMIFPSCIGDFKVAIALMAKFSSIGKCPGDSGYNASTDDAYLYYKRDINQPLLYNMAATGAAPDLVNLNPSHPYIETNDNVKNSQTDIFYTTSMTIAGNVASVTHTWNGSWSTATAIGNDSNILFSSDYTVGTSTPPPGGNTTGFTINSIQVADGKTVTIPDGKFIKVFNDGITNGTSATRGKVVVANQGNFVQSCNESSIKAPYVELTKTTRAMNAKDYVYWGSPVSDNIITQFPSAFGRKYRWVSGTGGGWSTIASSQIGEGFITRIETAGANAVTLKGIANNGVLNSPTFTNYAGAGDGSTNADYADYALLSNPYPCALDAKTFLSNPKNSGIVSTLYFWTSNTALLDGVYLADDPYRYNYNPEDYASWNLTGGTGTVATEAASTGGAIPSGFIASGQGFFAEINATGNVYFDNSMRLTANNTQFYKQSHSTKPQETNRTQPLIPPGIEEGRLWLNVSKKGCFRQLLLGYVKGATNDYDKQYDGVLYSDSPILIYTMVGDKDLVIQGRQLPFDENESIPIGIDAVEAGEFYINIDQVDGFFKHQNVILKDNLLGLEQDLKQTAYKFTTNAGRFDNRFELKFTGKSVGLLGVNQEKNNADTVLVFTQNNQLKVTSSKEEITAITVFDITGKKIVFKNNSNKKEVVLDKLSKQNQVILVKIKLANNTELTKKVLF